MENPTRSFRETNLVLQLIYESQIKSKTAMNWSSRNKKQGLFCTFYFARRKFFSHLRFISMHRVLNTLSECTYFYISKNINSYTFLLVFKIIESLHCMLRSYYLILSWWNLGRRSCNTPTKKPSVIQNI